MQKKLIVLASASVLASAIAAPVFAQSSNVQIYGLVDVGLEVGNSGFGTKTRIQSGQSQGSRIGFKGEEALGNGLAAFFTIESGFSLDNGQTTVNGAIANTTDSASTAKPLFQRQALAGLKGGWGQLSAGRQYTPAYIITATVDPFSAGLGGQFPAVLRSLPAVSQRYDNSAMYVSPDMSGFKLLSMYSTGYENNTRNTALNNDRAGEAWTLAGQYANGPAYAGLSYQEAYRTSNAVKAQSWLWVGSWDFKVVKVSALWSEGDTDNSVINIVDERNWSVGLSAPLGTAAKLLFTYGDHNDKLAANADARIWSLGGEYALSRRTALYAAYTKIENENASAWAIHSALFSGLTTTSSYDPYAVQFGLRHSF